MFWFQIFVTFKMGDRPRHSESRVVRSRRKTQTLCGLKEDPPRVIDGRPRGPLRGLPSRSRHAHGHGGGRFAGCSFREIAQRQRRNLHLDLESIEQRPGQARPVVRDDGRRARARPVGTPELAAGARVHRAHESEAARHPRRVRDPVDHDRAVLAGVLDDDPKVKPDKHIYVEFKAPWDTITDDLPQMTKQQIRAHRARQH